MKQEFYNLQIKTNGQKLYEFTNDTIHWIGQNNFKNGILNLSIQHTSASLIVQENADPDVQTDLINYFDKLAPMDNKLYVHTTEGKDDKSSISHKGDKNYLASEFKKFIGFNKNVLEVGCGTGQLSIYFSIGIWWSNQICLRLWASRRRVSEDPLFLNGVGCPGGV